MKETVNFSKLVADAVNGNQSAFKELYDLTVQSSYYTANLLLNNADDVEDVLQNSYSKAFERLSELKDPDKFESWLKSIVENESKNYIKKSKRISAPIVFIKNKVEDNSEEWNQPIPQEYLEREELRQSVTRILDKLSPEIRACVVLFHYENKSMNEIAQMLDIPLGTVKSRLYNGRKQIEKEFNKLRKKDPNLYSIAAIPALLSFIALSAKNITVPAMLSEAVFASVTGTAIPGVGTAAATTAAASATTAGAAATGAATASTAAAAGTAIAAKVVAVAVAGTVVVGGSVAVKNHIDEKAANETSLSHSVSFTIEETCTLTEFVNEVFSVTVQELSTTSIASETEQRATQATRGATVNNAVTSARSTTASTTAKRTTTKPVTTTKKTTTTKPTTTKATTARATTTKVVTTKPSTTKTATTKPITTRPTTVALTTNPANNYASSGGVITEYRGNGANVSIPSSIGSDTVTAIGAGAFAGDTNIKTVSLPSTVTQIGQEAFADCTSLTSVSLPSSLNTIGVGAFYGCTKLNSVSVPGGTKTISDEAFAQCTNLSTITIPSSVTSISADAFDGCDSLTIRCAEGSAAHDYAVENGINYTLI